jgi:hypothetical protein
VCGWFAGSEEDVAGKRTGVISLVDYDDAVHDDVRNADGILCRFFEGRLVTDCGGIEDGDIGGHAGAQQAPIGEPGDLRGQRRHLAHSVGQTDYFFLAHVNAETACSAAAWRGLPPSVSRALWKWCIMGERWDIP